MLVVHDWLKEYMGEKIPSVEKLEELLMIHSFEVECIERVGDYDVIDVDILPNRASDCLCHRGIAKEISALVGAELKNDPFSKKVDLSPVSDKLAITIEDSEACRRFGVAIVTGVKIGESPDWLKERLEAVGQRTINNVVDITNYVMLSLGQPMHAYDGDKFPKVDGVWKFGIRFARDDESVVTLSDEEVNLDTSIQLIVEGDSDTAVGIAGIKGGKMAEVDENTTTIIFEAANFDPTITRKAAQKIKLQTDASKRFENEVSSGVVPFALKEAVRVLEEISGGKCEGYLDKYPTPSENKSVFVTLEKINALLGLNLTENIIEDVFVRLGFKFDKNNSSWDVIAPFERKDIKIAEDIVEEVGRVYGYFHIDSVLPDVTQLVEFNARHYYSEVIRKILIGRGFSEVITSSFRNKDKVRLRNALASDKGCLRSSLVKNITEVLDKNISNVDLLGLKDIRVFEIGTVFHKTEDGIGEHISVTLGARIKQSGHTPKDDVILEEAKEALTEVFGTKIIGNIEKGVMEFNLTEMLDKLPKPTSYEELLVGEEKQYKPFSQYPYISRDISLWVSNSPSEDLKNDIINVMRTVAGSLLVRITLFDEFTKDGKTSYAFRLIFQSYEKTLTDDEVNERMVLVETKISENGWEVR